MDREQFSKLRLKIFAGSAFTNQNTSTVLEVVFLDINDNPPKFTSPPEIICIPEKLENKILTSLFTFTVTDADVDQNAMVRFRLLDCPVLGYENDFDIIFEKLSLQLTFQVLT